MKERISEAEQLQLIGLLALAAHHNKALEDIKIAALEVLDIRESDATAFNNPEDQVSDAVYGSRTPRELLQLLGIVVLRGDVTTDDRSEGGDAAR